ncbi:MAG: hypothetical protein QNJ47_20100 [Nostocaceae cyanobacterium]|nr:hypothetical protein [Nostocaceae cyanobacterium]
MVQVISYCQLLILPITNYQLPITNYQLPITHKKKRDKPSTSG